MIYLSELLGRSGHESYFLNCDATVPFCYNRLLKGNSKLVECSKCLIGSCRSFSVKNITGIKKYIKANLPHDKLVNIVDSASFSLHRIETDADSISDEVINTQKNLYDSANIVYENSVRWIEDNDLQSVILFNGRLDLPRAVLTACEDKKIPYITFESAYPGIALKVNEDCRGLKSMNKMVQDYIDLPMTLAQSYYAAKIGAQMLMKKNYVWKLFNVNHKQCSWPINSNNKVLIVPSSNHEFFNFNDYMVKWKSNGDALDNILEKLGVSNNDCVIRCHPYWSVNVGATENGYKSERYYTEWAKMRNIYIIPSNDNANTMDLINEADIIIVQHGTAAIEAGLLGKRIIGLTPSSYCNANFSIQIHGEDDLWKLDQLNNHNKEEVMRNTLRYLYILHKRFAQYTNYVKPQNNIYNNIYFEGGSSDPIIKALKTGYIQSDDTSFAQDPSEENIVLNKVKNKEWEDLMNWKEKDLDKNSFYIKRRLGLKGLDSIRLKMLAGDS